MTEYRKEIESFMAWCKDNDLCNYVCKTEELIADIRKQSGQHVPCCTNGADMEMVDSVNLLEVMIINNLHQCNGQENLKTVCCLPGARIQDITDRVQRILKGEGEDPEVVVHVGTNDVGKKRRSILQRDFRELRRKLKSRTSRVVISGLLPVPQAGKGRNREIMDLNVWLRDWCQKQGFKFLDHWESYQSSLEVAWELGDLEIRL
ncbi:uncharacterized protein LOC132209499 [Stegostoma tigrinum]|uniref:uncharacterized protein LOC132209499 n=1 Tax=Stegostoma tigrinum TaxID=3053191 RepID=UPI00286FC89D|nr:uncharacterized protein LOC132209499 [Stegostoma tigrinum]